MGSCGTDHATSPTPCQNPKHYRKWTPDALAAYLKAQPHLFTAEQVDAVLSDSGNGLLLRTWKRLGLRLGRSVWLSATAGWVKKADSARALPPPQDSVSSPDALLVAVDQRRRQAKGLNFYADFAAMDGLECKEAIAHGDAEKAARLATIAGRCGRKYLDG